MIRKTLKHSSNGSLAAGVNYVLSDTDSKNAPRPTPPKIISGDKDMLLEIEKDMKTQHTYVHSVLSFTSDEMKNLSDDDKQEIAQSYIEQLAAGLPDKDRLAVLAVDHGDDMHFLCLRKDLETDKSYQPYVQQRGDKYRFNLWNESMQEQHSALIDPNDPEFMRLVVNGEARPGDHEHKSSLQNQVLDDISSRFSKGKIKSRDDIIDYLRNRDDIEISQRRGKDNITDKSITIKSKTNPDMQNIRLKGALFEKGWPRIDSDFKPKRATPKTPEPTKKLAELNGKLNEKAIEKYGKSKSSDVNDIHDLLKQNQSTLREMIDADERLKRLKGEVDRPERKVERQVEKPAYVRPAPPTLSERIDKVEWSDSIATAKDYLLNENHSQQDIINVAHFIMNADAFLTNYENHKMTRNDNENPTPEDIEMDNKWIAMYNDTAEAIDNMTDNWMSDEDDVIDNKDDVIDNDDDMTNLQAFEQELKTLENTMNNELKQHEIQMNTEQSKAQTEQQTRQQKKNTRGGGGGGGRAPKVVDNSKQMMSIWKQGEFEQKRNDARNHAIRQKSMREHDNAPRPKKKKKDDDDK